jgi:hypothetical protein
MVSPPSSPETGDQPESVLKDSSEQPARPPHHMSPRNRLLFFVTAWLIVLLPFLFWWNTWFGRQLSDKQITEYLKDEKHPRHIQHALVQLGERMGRHGASATLWYPELLRLATHPVEEVRNTDAWVMGQDTSGAGFHVTLLRMLQDSSAMVRGNAALSLVRFGDAAGRPQIVALLQPARILAPSTGRVTDTDKVGTAIHQGGLIAKIQVDRSAVAREDDRSAVAGEGDRSALGSQTGHQIIEVRSPISGRIRTLSVAAGRDVVAGSEIATVAPGDEQVWEALRALYLIGQLDDLPAIRPYQRELPEISVRVRQQALLTEKAIRDRAVSHP